MFDVWFLDANKEKKFCWQTSWGLSTRSIGTMIMVHSDDVGLVLPPKVALTQVVVVPIVKKGDNEQEINKYSQEVYQEIKAAGIRVELDDRDNYNPGFKFNHWEQRGVPIRLEIGTKDMANGEVRCCKRHDNVKSQIKKDSVRSEVTQLLEQIHQEMF
jgi:prolyl-tRNA synthetase